MSKTLSNTAGTGTLLNGTFALVANVLLIALKQYLFFNVRILQREVFLNEDWSHSPHYENSRKLFSNFMVISYWKRCRNILYTMILNPPAATKQVACVISQKRTLNWKPLTEMPQKFLTANCLTSILYF